MLHDSTTLAEIEQLKDNGLSVPLSDTIIQDLADTLNSTFSFASLSDHDKESVLKALLMDYAKADLKSQVDAARVNVPQEIDTFINTYKSTYTQSAYKDAIKRYMNFIHLCGVSFVSADAKVADEFIYDMITHEERAPGSVRLTVAAVSSFYTFLERRYPDIVKNPFRGTKARPKIELKRECIYPNRKEVDAILESPELSQRVKAAAFAMAFCGLRVGGLADMKISADGKSFTTYSKGKKYTGKLPAGFSERLAMYGRNIRFPFSDISARSLSAQFIECTKKLYQAGKIDAPYSCHDLRHFFARTEYEKDHDLYRVSKLLNHSSIQVTETYLKDLNVIQ